MNHLLKLLAIILLLSSCSAEYHKRRMFKKDPDIFEVESKREKQAIPTPSVTQVFDCDSLKRNGITLITPRAYIVNGDAIKDTVKTNARMNDKGEVELKVECPDAQIIIETVPEPYPVYVKPSLLEKMKFGACSLGIVLLLYVVFRLFKEAFFK